MANNYRLTFVELYKLGTEDIVFTYNQDRTSTRQVDINSKDCTLTLMSFSYSKAIYRPGELEITLKLTSINDTLSFTDIEATHKLLMSKYINVEFQDSLTDSEAFSIAELFRVFDVQIEKRMASGETLSVIVKAFDPLKHLALDKFCSAYTCKKLIRDVIMNEKVWPAMAPVNIKGELTNAKTTMDEINKLKYELQTQENAKAEETKKKIKEKEEKCFIVTNTTFLTYSDNKNKTYTEFIQREFPGFHCPRHQQMRRILLFRERENTYRLGRDRTNNHQGIQLSDVPKRSQYGMGGKLYRRYTQ